MALATLLLLILIVVCWCVGLCVCEQLGTGDRQDRVTPVEVCIHSDMPTTTRVSACAAGDQFSACVWGAGGEEGGWLYTWGSNVYGAFVCLHVYIHEHMI